MACCRICRGEGGSLCVSWARNHLPANRVLDFRFDVTA
jgi:hypothetical protein